MTNKTPSGARKHHESSKPKTCKTAKAFLSSFFRGATCSSVLRVPLTPVSTWSSSLLYGAVHNPIACSQIRSLTRHSWPLTQKLWLPVCDPIFSFLYTCTPKDHLAMKRNNCWIRTTVGIYLGLGLKNWYMHCVFNRTRWMNEWVSEWVSECSRLCN